jgi:spectinomycin phosphotransferase
MLTPPDIATETICAWLRERYSLLIQQVMFLPLGADVNSAVYRIEAGDGRKYFLKLKRGEFVDLQVTLPAWLHARGLVAVMAPLASGSGDLWSTGHGYTWTLYPFFEGVSVYDAPFTDERWVSLGATLRSIHDAHPPPDIASRLPNDDYAPRYRDAVRAYDQRVDIEVWDDPIAARLAMFWLAQRETIRLVVARAEELAGELRQRAVPHVLCHGDFHGRNILLGANGALTIVDWDAAIFAPKERDTMFAGTLLSGEWDDTYEVARFYEGYSASGPDPVAEAYYRYERIATDIAEFADQIFGVVGSAENRDRSYHHFTGQFAPQQDFALAHRAYARL